MKFGGMGTLKHEIHLPKFYELFIKTELKGNTALDLNTFYNHIKLCLNAVNRLREDLFFLITSPSKYTLSLNNTSYQIMINLPILGMNRPTLPLDTKFW